TPLARRLLWVATLASEPVTEALIQGVWSGQTLEQEQLQEVRAFLARVEQLPPEQRPEVPPLSPEERALLEKSGAEGVLPVPPVGPLLAELRDAGLLSVEGEGDGASYSFHELVRERAAARMEAHPEERGGRTAEQVWEAYGERYAAAFNALSKSGKPGAKVQAGEAGWRALSYLVRAGAFQHLRSFASNLVTGTRDPTLLRGVIAELEAVADQVPAGEARWSVRTYLADAVKNAGQ